MAADQLQLLHDLELPPYLDGEMPPWRDQSSWSIAHYTPDGQLIPGHDMASTFRLVVAAKADKRNHRRTEFMVEGSGECAVSTVYLGLDHQHGAGPILIWETMIFGGPADDWQWRYSTRAAAMLGHQRIVDALARILGHPPQVEAVLPALQIYSSDDEEPS